jgi:phosphinothricin acetyltransferase
MGNTLKIRLIQSTDCQQVLDIYKPYVTATAITFEYEVPTPEDFADRISTITSEYPWLVCMKDDQIVGYAYASRFRYRTAYQWSAESTVYLAPEAQGMGLGIALYETLFAILRLQGFINVFAGAAMPNEKSERLHKQLGFEEIGIFKEIGYKMGKWHSTKWFQLSLADHTLEPAPPRTMPELVDSEDIRQILDRANEKLNGS